ncbi:MAG: PTS sucrose transporter subunit IIABC [Candidatus Aminicenantes bacterium 4484_214]|nr:MAG: PTS sucrose transporter subunit IIABC [Candidatus Aminicenantes bacterium 4484_214]RLE10757.1 MAG: PTS sugar transporter subunit IIA [Candidatus Aminicenantes bacterium]
MNLKKILTSDDIILSLSASTKKEVIREMVECLHQRGKIEDKEAALQAIMEREKKMSTGLEKGVALPHGKCEAVKELVAAIALKHEGVDFGCLDGQPAKIFIMTLSPLNRSGPHIQFLAEITRLLKNKERREKILQAQSEEEVLEILCS